MKLNSTLKKFFRVRRKTAKSGGVKLSASAPVYIPKNIKESNKLNLPSLAYVPNIKELNASSSAYVPNIKESNAINNLSSMMASISINTKRSRVSMKTLTKEWAKIKDKIENAVAIDCEMVGIGPYNESALAHVAIVDFNGNKIYDKYVIPKGGIDSITDYRTEYSGITPEILSDLNKGRHHFQTIKNEVAKKLKNKTIIGHGLINDFKVLEFVPNPDMVWDTTIIDTYLQNHPYIENKRQPRKLKAISKEFADNNIQNPDKTGHSPLEDARASLNLYRLSFSYPKIVYSNMSL